MPRRHVKHQTILNKICKDERLSPNRRLLGEMLALWLDCTEEKEKDALLKVILANFGSSQRTFWLDREDGKSVTNPPQVDVEASKIFKEYFSAVERGETPNEIFTENVDSTSE